MVPLDTIVPGNPVLKVPLRERSTVCSSISNVLTVYFREFISHKTQFLMDFPRYFCPLSVKIRWRALSSRSVAFHISSWQGWPAQGLFPKVPPHRKRSMKFLYSLSVISLVRHQDQNRSKHMHSLMMVKTGEGDAISCTSVQGQ